MKMRTPIVMGLAAGLALLAGAAATMVLTNNSREPLRVSAMRAVTLEQLDPRGATVTFAGGANLGCVPHAAYAVTLAPGQSLSIPITGIPRLDGRELAWRGDDGVMGTWAVDPAAIAEGLRPAAGS